MAALNVGTTAVKLPVVGKQRALVQNLGPGTVYLGEDDGVTVDNGVELVVNATYEGLSPVSSDGEMWVISDTADTDVRYLALGG